MSNSSENIIVQFTTNSDDICLNDGFIRDFIWSRWDCSIRVYMEESTDTIVGSFHVHNLGYGEEIDIECTFKLENEKTKATLNEKDIYKSYEFYTFIGSINRNVVTLTSSSSFQRLLQPGNIVRVICELNLLQVFDNRDLEIVPLFEKSVYGFDNWWNGPFTDAEIEVGDKVFKVHKIVVCSVSEYFSKLFTSEFQEAQTSRVSIKDIDVDVMEYLLSIMYHRDPKNIKLDVDKAFAVIEASSRFQVNSISKIVEITISKNIATTNVLNICIHSHTLGLQKMYNLCMSYLRFADTLHEVLQLPDTPSFLEAHAEFATNLLIETIHGNKRHKSGST